MQTTRLKLILHRFAIPVLGGLGFVLLALTHHIHFIPLVHNVILLISFVCEAAALVLMFLLVKQLSIKKIFRILIYIVLVLLSVASCFANFLLFSLDVRSLAHFEYQNQTYYYNYEGFIDPYYGIYRQNDALTTTKIGEYYNYIGSPDTLSEQDKQIIVIQATQDGMRRAGDTKSSSVQSSAEKNSNNQESISTADEISALLNTLKPSDVIRIQNSSYGLVWIDKAMAQYRWIFVVIDEQNIRYISELPATSATVEGQIEDEGSILVTCTDTDDSQQTYRSTDGGRTWELSS
ncbi:hypothetical protein [Atopobium fossor]|uniref:hypothetical protein n=1 Tax=Atopobium fossor TaxID=39487 RepID=UPI0004039184|nr:hypothetical protein [Atopobium fossor]